MIKRYDILEILKFKNPDLCLAINLDTWEIFDNPNNFSMPSDSTLYRWASEFDAYKEEEARKKDRVLNELAQSIGVNMSDENMTTDEIKQKIKEALI